MKTLILFISLAITTPVSTWACPKDLSGEYKFENGDLLIVKQTGCETMEINFTFNRYTAKVITDGKSYEKSYNNDFSTPKSYWSSYSNIPAKADAWSFDKAFYRDNIFVWQQFYGNPTLCLDKYSFSHPDCRIHENSFGYYENLGSFMLRQTGGCWDYTGFYCEDDFLLTKVK